MRGFKVLYALILSALMAAAAPALAADTALPAPSSLSGAYLSGRFAQQHDDWSAAHAYMGAVLTQDPGNTQLEQRTFLLALGASDFDRARALAEKISASKDGFELATIYLACDALAEGKYDDALALLKKLPEGGFGQYTKPVLTAWSLAGLGRKDEALKILPKAEEGASYDLHAGMIQEFSGDMNAAADSYKKVMQGEIDFNAAVLLANFYERYGQPEISTALYRGLGKAYPFNPFVAALAHRDPKRDIEPNIARPAAGAARALFDIATLLYGRRAYDSAQIYGNLVLLLDKQSSFARMMLGDIAAATGQTERAAADYGQVAQDDPLYTLSRIRVAEINEAAGRTDDAVDMLKDIARDDSTRVQAQVALGDVYRRHSRFSEAVDAYNDALKGVEPVDETLWPVLYARGISYAQMHRWDLGEKDLLQALAFQPKNPMILNFLAYSWADKGVNLDQALEFAKSAAALKPNDGYILDSYGWTLFRLGRYDEAVTWLESAVDRAPGDSTLLDHLGDAYWQSGRTDDARAQWKRASDMSRDDVFKKTLAQKMKDGIATPDRKQAKL